MTETPWYYEAPDPSVGLFAAGWMHECGTEEFAEGIVISEEMKSDGFTQEITWEFTCSCGAKKTTSYCDVVFDEEPDSDVEAPVLRATDDPNYDEAEQQEAEQAAPFRCGVLMVDDSTCTKARGHDEPHASGSIIGRA